MSNFWFYTIMVIAIAHLIAFFVLLAVKLSPKKDKKEPHKKTNEKK